MLRSTIVISLLLSACASSEPTDELAGESEAASTVDSAYTYFEIWRDQRKCASPMCGGFFVARLNRSCTPTYVPALDIADELESALVDAATIDATSDGVHAIVRGRVVPDRFVVTEAWVEEGDAVSDGVFVRAQTNRIQCITAPCPTITETALNTSRQANIAAIDWSYAGVDASDQLAGGVILAGDRYTYTENGHPAKGRTATAVYLQLK